VWARLVLFLLDPVQDPPLFPPSEPFIPVTQQTLPLRVLVAEDDPLHRALLIHPLVQDGMEVQEAVDGESALQAISGIAPDVLLLDMRMPGMDGMEVLRRLRSVSDPPEVLVVTGDGTAATAVAAIRLGARDYITKPWSPEALLTRVRNAGEHRRLVVDVRRQRARAALEAEAPQFLTRDPQLRRQVAAALGAAPSGVPILISGEPGTGKELLARRIHALSRAGEGAFVVVNASGDPGTVQEELFGVEGRPGEDRAARMGLVELADGGTLLIEEVDSLPEGLQERLIRLVAEGVMQRSAAGPIRRVAVRVIGVSERPLAEQVAGGRIRAETLHRLGIISVDLPPLRERRGDVRLLARHFLRTLPAGGEHRVLSQGAGRRLQAYSWPGNVRELRNVIERTLLLAAGTVVEEGDLPLESSLRRPPTPIPGQGIAEDAAVSLAELERRHITRVLASTGWHRGRAARVLGIAAKTLYRKVREYGITPP